MIYIKKEELSAYQKECLSKIRNNGGEITKYSICSKPTFMLKNKEVLRTQTIRFLIKNKKLILDEESINLTDKSRRYILNKAAA